MNIPGNGYYSEKLSGDRLRRCYEIAPPPVVAYLQAEIDYVLTKTASHQFALELGCGYGRVLRPLARHVRALVGIDISLPSLRLAAHFLDCFPSCRLAVMDAISMGFPDGAFDLVICIQNGISAFGVNQQALVGEALRVTRRGGTVLFSSYSEKFWEHRLTWFRLQAEHGLIGEIDETATGNGVIVCKDGFRATTVTPDDFQRLAAHHNIAPRIIEVNNSSLFCEMTVP